jgi:hypothetical protein
LGKNTWTYPKGVEPHNLLQTWGPQPASTHGGHREFDLDLKWENKKIKLVHRVMICDVLPRKNIEHDIPRFRRKTLHKNGTK